MEIFIHIFTIHIYDKFKGTEYKMLTNVYIKNSFVLEKAVYISEYRFWEEQNE